MSLGPSSEKEKHHRSLWNLLALAAVVHLLAMLIGLPGLASAQPVTPEMVKNEFLHAWNSYKQHAWGHDLLDPLSKHPREWYSQSLCLTPVDAFDTMILMGLTPEAAEAKKLILDSLSFRKDMEVQAFEVTIRMLGGLLSAYQLDGDPRFLALAQDLGNRLLPVFETPTHMPRRFVNLLTGKIRDSLNNPAEIGTSLLEFGTLSKLTGNPKYYDRAKEALVQLYRHRSKIGLVGTWINVETGEWTDRTSHIGGAIDSYYEYLYKCWLLFGDKDCREMWDESIRAINTYVADTTHGGLWYGQVDMDTGKRTGTEFGSLEAFFPGLLCLSGDVTRAARLEESCFRMWNLNGIEPDEFDYGTMKVTAPEYYLRPEIIESAYYLHHFTGDTLYTSMGEIFFYAIVQFCRTDAGYAILKDVRTKEQSDRTESFFFAETLKYLYLLFAPASRLALNDIVFTTEAHPLQRTWKR